MPLFLAMLMTLLGVVWEAESLDGGKTRGAPGHWDGETLRLVDGTQPIDVPLNRLARVVRIDADDANNRRAPRPIHVRLTEGTEIRGEKVSIEGTDLVLRRDPDTIWRIPLRLVANFRLQADAADTEKAWGEMIQRDFTSDALIIRRAQGSLDFLEGIVQSVNEEQVEFKYEGESMQVPRRKVEGLVLASPKLTSPAPYRVNTLGGERIRATRLALDGERVTIRLGDQSDIIMSVAEVGGIEVEQEDQLYLSALNPEVTEVTPFVADLEDDPELQTWLYGVWRDRDPQGSPLTLRDPKTRRLESFAHGVSLHSRTKIAYRLDARFRELRGLVGMDPSGDGRNRGEITIRAGDQVLFQEVIRAEEPPRVIQIALPDTRRLELLFDYGGDGDFGDRLHLVDLRLIK